jgi:hypothetical protein
MNLLRRPCTDNGQPGEELLLAFDEPEARGTIVLRECVYGLEVVLPDLSPDPVALLDLWHASPAGQSGRRPNDPAPVLQVIVHSPTQTEDPMGRVRFFPERTVVDLELGVTCETTAAGAIWAYPLPA